MSVEGTMESVATPFVIDCKLNKLKIVIQIYKLSLIFPRIYDADEHERNWVIGPRSFFVSRTSMRRQRIYFGSHALNLTHWLTFCAHDFFLRKYQNIFSGSKIIFRFSRSKSFHFSKKNDDADIKRKEKTQNDLVVRQREKFRLVNHLI